MVIHARCGCVMRVGAAVTAATVQLRVHHSSSSQFPARTYLVCFVLSCFWKEGSTKRASVERCLMPEVSYASQSGNSAEGLGKPKDAKVPRTLTLQQSMEATAHCMDLSIQSAACL
jgi:hypothetical protein